MAERKPFLIRVDPALLEALERWAADEFRSLNAQIEFILRQAAARAGRLPEGTKTPKTRTDLDHEDTKDHEGTSGP